MNEADRDRLKVTEWQIAQVVNSELNEDTKRHTLSVLYKIKRELE